MLRYEFKKLFKDRVIIFFAMLFIFADVYIIYQEAAYIRNYKVYDHYEDMKEIYNNVKGPISNDKINYLLSGGENTSAVRIQMYEEIIELCDYRNRAEAVADKAAANGKAYEMMGDYAQAAANERIERSFRNRSIDEYYSRTGMRSYFIYDYSTLMVIILAAVIGHILFGRDRRIQMDRIVESSKNGGIRVAAERLLAMQTAAVFLMCLFRLLELVAYSIIYGFEGLHMPLYSISEFKGALYRGSILSFIAADLLLKCLGILVFVTLLGLLMYIIPKSAVSAGFFAGIYAGYIYASFNMKLYYNPIQLLDAYSMVKQTDDSTYIIWLSAAIVVSLMLLFLMAARLKRRVG